jgi:putative flippase GtrA
MLSQLRLLLRFLRDNDLRTIVAALHSREVHPVIQFFKYALCGVVAFVVQAVVFFTLSRWVLPALESNVADHTVRANHALINTGIALLFGNTAAWLLNRRWVFTPGRHAPVTEYVLFTLVNAPGALGGAVVQDWIIRSLHWPTWAAFAGFVLPNVLINFACRKLFIFRG